MKLHFTYSVHVTQSYCGGWLFHCDEHFVYSLAHTTQFTKPGYHYLPQGSGAGHLIGGGSYVTFIDPDTKDFTIVIETMVCVSIL